MANFIVVESGLCLLGYLTATNLGILRGDPTGTLGTGNCNTVDDTLVGELKANYLGVFQGIGKFKDYQLKLHVDPSVTPVVQKMRRVPCSVKDKVTTKVNELLKSVSKIDTPMFLISILVLPASISPMIKVNLLSNSLASL